MKNKIYMLSTPSCTKCPIVKMQLSEKDVDVEVEYVNVEEEPDIAIEHGLMSVPSIIDNRNGEDVIYTGQGACMEFIAKL